ncbi:hypothetical protein ACM61V_16075 [Sphingomonas sp. TX0543]|uniref:hypothetical protein n=1 Tax=Sphingomonas sp. TX0543 TaxID=3399682 RepID=UPI003AFB6B9B
MTRCDSDYYERRAEQELELAEHATKPKVVAAHDRLAELYLERLSPQSKAAQDDHQRVSHGSAAVTNFPVPQTPESSAELIGRKSR